MMNDTENYLLHQKSILSRLIPAGFLINLLGVMLAFGTVYAFYTAVSPTSVYSVQIPVVSADLNASVTALIQTQTKLLTALVLLFLSGFTVFSKTAAFFLCSWRGAGLGCTAALLSSGSLKGVSDSVNTGLFLAFFAALLYVLLASYSAVYADCILHTCSNGKYRYVSSLVKEYFLCFLTLSGIVLAAGILSILCM